MFSELSGSRSNLLGVNVSAINMGQALDVIDNWVEQRTPNYVCVTPAHAVMECYDHPELRTIYNRSGLTTPDGMAVVWWLKLHGYKHVERVYGPDLMLAVCQQSLTRKYRHFFYGGTPDTLQALIDSLQVRFPGLQVAGCYSPPYRPLTQDEDDKVVNQITQSAADIVWVGIGSPRQEQWMSAHVGRVNVPVLIGVGAAFDFLSGRKPQAPRWMQRSGLEWFFRLLNEPRRLWRRYLLGYPRFIVLVILQSIGLLKFTTPRES